LLITPASFGDNLTGRFLVVLAFQLDVTSMVLAILGGFSGAVLLVVFYVFPEVLRSLSLGLVFGPLLIQSNLQGQYQDLSPASLSLTAFLLVNRENYWGTARCNESPG